MNEDARFDRLSRAWDSVVAWNAGADPLCPCKSLVAPHLQDWLNFRADWLAGAPDGAGLDEQTKSLRDAVATINQYSRSGPIGDLNRDFTAYKVGVMRAERLAEGDACSPGDPRCAPLPRDPGPIAASDDAKRTWGLQAVDSVYGNPGAAAGPSRQTDSELRRELPALRGMLGRLDPIMGAVPDAGPLGILGSLPGLLGETARGAGEQAGTAAGQAAGQAAATAAQTAAPAVAAAIRDSLQAQLPALAASAGQAAAPIVTPLAQNAGTTAGAAAGKAAIDSAKGAAGDAWPTPLKVGIGILGIGAVGTAMWALLTMGKRR